ncbi:MAG: calcium/sodium antiporter [Bacteroidales bacterium]|nr:calcium/sodium antiporter [Bacteroidales bacterium]
MNILILIAGLALILLGANYLVDGASAIAKKWGISEFVIGMTIVGIGTSTPEMVVSFLSAAQGNADIAVGNVVGSNLFNTLMILGVTALIMPLPLTGNNIKKDIPFALLAAATLIFAGSDVLLDGASANIISRTDGLMLLSLFGVFMAYTIYSSQTQNAPALSEAKAEMSAANAANAEGETKERPMWLALIMVVGGLAGLVYGGNLFVDSASSLAKMLGVSDAVIAVTIMAGGTSLPELASCAVAAVKKNADLALGNVIGSNVANIFLILGGSAVIHPLGMNNIGNLDFSTLIISTILLFITAFTFKKRTLDRAEAILFILIYVGYIILTLNK